MSVVEAYAVGETVWIGLGCSIVGEVLAVQLGPAGAITYRVAWWDGPRRCVEWLEACEVAPQGPKAEIGFRHAPA